MPARIACHPMTFGPHGWRCAVERLHSMGIEWIELPIASGGDGEGEDTDSPIDAFADESDVARVQRLLADRGLGIACCDLLRGNPLDDAEFDGLCRKLHVAAALGVPCVVGSAGDVESAGELAALTDRLGQLGDVAASLGIVYCLRTEPGLCADHRGMLETVDAVGHRHIRLSFDPGELLYHNEHVNAEVALAKTCHLVRHVALADSQGEFGRRYSPALGRGGAVDFYRTLQLLKTCGFEGPYSLTLRGVDGESPPHIDTVLERIRDSTILLRRLGYFE